VGIQHLNSQAHEKAFDNRLGRMANGKKKKNDD